MNEFSVREIARGIELNEGHTDINSLGKLLMDAPDQFTPTLIYLWGQNSNVFPITTLTEGQIGGTKEVNSVVYDWKTAGKPRYSDEVAFFNSDANATPGVGGTAFEVGFKSTLFIEQYGLIAPDGTKYRIMAKPKPSGNGGGVYSIQPKDGTKPCNLENLKQGAHWVMTAPTIPEAYSRGNRYNKIGVGKMYNQIAFQRYTMDIGGNVANKVSTIEFPTEGGGTTNLWINEEWRRFEHDVLKFSEEQHWTSEFNRLPNGEILMKDWDNDEVIPESAGVIEMVKETNYLPYGEIMGINTLNLAIDTVTEADTDTGNVEVVVYGGLGFAADMDGAIKNDIRSNGFQIAMGDKMISGGQGSLSYGNNFTQYVNIKGDKITFKHLKMLDYGPLAELDKLNGNIHPISGKPMSSHTGFFLDQSLYSGERNVQMAVQKGQGDIYGILKGLAPIPEGWGRLIDTNAISTEVDASKYERKLSKGINILSTVRCMMVQGKK